MADDTQDQADDLDLTDNEAEQLLADAVAEEERAAKAEQAEESSQEDTTDWKAEAEKWKRLSRKNEASFREVASKLKQYEDANKSESQRQDRKRTRLN